MIFYIGIIAVVVTAYRVPEILVIRLMKRISHTQISLIAERFGAL